MNNPQSFMQGQAQQIQQNQHLKASNSNHIRKQQCQTSRATRNISYSTYSSENVVRKKHIMPITSVEHPVSILESQKSLQQKQIDTARPDSSGSQDLLHSNLLITSSWAAIFSNQQNLQLQKDQPLNQPSSYQSLSLNKIFQNQRKDQLFPSEFQDRVFTTKFYSPNNHAPHSPYLFQEKQQIQSPNIFINTQQQTFKNNSLEGLKHTKVFQNSEKKQQTQKETQLKSTIKQDQFISANKAKICRNVTSQNQRNCSHRHRRLLSLNSVNQEISSGQKTVFIQQIASPKILRTVRDSCITNYESANNLKKALPHKGCCSLWFQKPSDNVQQLAYNKFKINKNNKNCLEALYQYKLQKTAQYRFNQGQLSSVSQKLNTTEKIFVVILEDSMISISFSKFQFKYKYLYLPSGFEVGQELDPNLMSQRLTQNDSIDLQSTLKLKRENQFEKDFFNMVESLKKTFDISTNQSKLIYLYFKDGTPITNVSCLKENQHEHTIFVSISPLFKGIYKQKNGVMLDQILKEMEIPLLVRVKGSASETEQQIPKTTLSYEQKFQNQYQKVIQNIIQTIQSDREDNMKNEQLDVNSVELEQILLKTRNKSVNKKNNEEQLNNQINESQIQQFNNVNEYLNSDKLLIKNQKIQDLDQIDQFYEKGLQKSTFTGREAQNGNSAIDNNSWDLFTDKNECQSNVSSKIREIANDLGILKKQTISPNSSSQLLLSPTLTSIPHSHVDIKIEKASSGSNNQPESEMLPSPSQSNEQYFTKKNNENLLVSLSPAISDLSIMNQKLEEQELQEIQMLQKISVQLQQLIDVEIENKKKKTVHTYEQDYIQAKTSSVGEVDRACNSDCDDTEELNEETQDQQKSFQVNFNKKNKKLIDFTQKNKKNIASKKSVLQEIGRLNQNLCRLNIPKIMLRIPQLLNRGKKAQTDQQLNFSRQDIHQIYTIYKSLHETTSQRYNCQQYDMEDGVDYNVYRNGLYQVFMQPPELARRIFNTIDYNYSGFMDWEEFLKLMVFMRAKTLKQKINLFIKIADEDGNGKLSKEEIFNLSKICLGKFINENQDSEFLNMLSEYYTRLIFDEVQIDIEDEIPLQKIKGKIISGTKERDLLCMFCGADI